jgi:MFS family permease
LGRAWTIRAGGLVAAMGMALVVVADSAATALAGFAVAGAGFSSIIPVVFAAGGRASPTNEAAGIATVSGIGYMGFLIGPPMIGFISEMSSLRAALGVVVVLSAAAAMLVGLADRRDAHGISPLAD